MKRIKRRHKALIKMRRTIRFISFMEFVNRRYGSWNKMLKRADRMGGDNARA